MEGDQYPVLVGILPTLMGTGRNMDKLGYESPLFFYSLDVIRKIEGYELTMTMEIPCNKKSKRIYFIRSDIIEWIKTGRRKTMSEIQAEADKYLLRSRNRRGINSKI